MMRNALASKKMVCSALMVGCMGLCSISFAQQISEKTLGLADGYRAAQANDHQLRAARAQAESVSENRPQAWSRVLPSVSLSSSRYDVTQTVTSGGLEQPQQKYRSEADSVVLRQSLFSMRNWAGISQANAQVQGAQADLIGQEQGIAERYATAYFNLLLAQEQSRLTRKQRDDAAVQLDAAQRAFKAGTGTKTDIDDIKAQLDRLTVAEIEAGQAILVAKEELGLMLGQRVDRIHSFGGSVELSQVLQLGGLDSWLAKKDQSPAVRGKLARLEAARQGVRLASADHYPTLDLVAQASRESSNDAYFINSKTESSAVGLVLSVPIFQGGGISSRVRQASADLVVAQEQYDQAAGAVGVDIRRHYYNLREGLMMVGAAQQALYSAEQALLANEKSFQAGYRRSLDVLAAQRNLLQANLDLRKAQLQAILAWLRLRISVGELTDEDMTQIDRLFAAPAAG